MDILAPLAVGDRFTLTHRAEPKSTFAAGAFTSAIGQVLPLKVGDLALAAVRLVDANVSEDGTAAELTFEVIAR